MKNAPASKKATIDVLVSKFKLSERVKLFTKDGAASLVNRVDVNTAMNMLLSLGFMNKAAAKKVLDQLVECCVCKLEVVEVRCGTAIYFTPQAGSGMVLKGGE